MREKIFSLLTIVDIQHQGVGTLYQYPSVTILGILHELDGIDAVRRKRLAVLAELGDLLLDIILEQVTKPLLVAVSELSQLDLELLLVEDVMDTNSAVALVNIRQPISRGGVRLVVSVSLVSARHAKNEIWLTFWRPW